MARLAEELSTNAQSVSDAVEAPPTAETEENRCRLVSVSTRKRILDDKRAQVKQRLTDIRASKRRAAAEEAQAVINREVEGLPIINEAQAKLPFEIDASHKVILCGGYAGCVKCAATASCASRANRLQKKCRGVCDDPWGGSRNRINRLLRGKPLRKGASWPDGSEEVRLQLLRTIA